jgi:hypothetical protein
MYLLDTYRLTTHTYLAIQFNISTGHYSRKNRMCHEKQES